MDTLKTAVVVLLLLAVLYGVYVVLNKPAEPLPQEIAWHQQQTMDPLQIDIGGSFGAPAGPAADVAGRADSSSWAPPGGLATTPPAAGDPPTQPPAKPVSEIETAITPPDLPTSLASQPSEKSAPDVTAVLPQSPGIGNPADSEASSSQIDRDAPVYEAASTDPPAAALAADSAPPVTPIGQDVPGFPPDDAEESAPPISFSPFDNALRTAQSKAQSEEWYDALWTLSLFYDSPDLTGEQQRQLKDWLDPLAARVIYSQEHLIEPAHQVERGETLSAIAQRYDVPWQLLANINGVANPDVLTPGTSIKVVRGPFRAEVNLERQELTIFAGKLYAGQFPITVGSDPAPVPGEYHVLDKLPGRTYYAGDGRTIPAADATNPYGLVWIDLGSDVCIHGSPQAGPPADGRGCISLSPRDANDLFGILSQGSTISIRR